MNCWNSQVNIIDDDEAKYAAQLRYGPILVLKQSFLYPNLSKISISLAIVWRRGGSRPSGDPQCLVITHVLPSLILNSSALCSAAASTGVHNFNDRASESIVYDKIYRLFLKIQPNAVKYSSFVSEILLLKYC